MEYSLRLQLCKKGKHFKEGICKSDPRFRHLTFYNPNNMPQYPTIIAQYPTDAPFEFLCEGNYYTVTFKPYVVDGIASGIHGVDNYVPKIVNIQ